MFGFKEHLKDEVVRLRKENEEMRCILSDYVKAMDEIWSDVAHEEGGTLYREAKRILAKYDHIPDTRKKVL